VAKPAQVRFYFDADLLGLAKVLATLRPDITYPGDPGGVVHRRERPPCTVTSPAALDPEWIPECARQGWVILTRDSRIQDRPAEREAVRLYGARMVALAGPEARNTWMQLEVVMSQWRRIESCCDEEGPFIYSATRTTFRPIEL
jgi:hypothetical protein